MVMILRLGSYIRFSEAYSVVVLPLPVGPVTSTIPCDLPRQCAYPFSVCSSMPRSPSAIRAALRSNKRITIVSPKIVGTVDTRMSILPLVPENSICPSCGTNRSAMFILAIILTRETIAACSRLGEEDFSINTPSMRYLIRTSFSKGSICTSLVRDSTASSKIRFTRLTKLGSRASSCNLAVVN